MLLGAQVGPRRREERGREKGKEKRPREQPGEILRDEEAKIKRTKSVMERGEIEKSTGVGMGRVK